MYCRWKEKGMRKSTYQLNEIAAAILLITILTGHCRREFCARGEIWDIEWRMMKRLGSLNEKCNERFRHQIATLSHDEDVGEMKSLSFDGRATIVAKTDDRGDDELEPNLLDLQLHGIDSGILGDHG
jgi:hypothetical protein